MEKTTKKLLKVAEYGAVGAILSYNYTKFAEYREATVKRVVALGGNANKKDCAKLFGTVFVEEASFNEASIMFAKALLATVDLVKTLKK